MSSQVPPSRRGQPTPWLLDIKALPWSAVFATALLLTLLLCQEATALEFQQKVQVEVWCRDGDGGLVSRIRSIVTNRLRQLDGIEVSEEDPEFKIELIAQEIEVGARQSVVALSVIITAPLGDLFSKMVAEKVVGEQGLIQKNFQELLEGREKVFLHQLRFCVDDGLDSELSELVAEFDLEILEPLRRAFDSS